jgi:hypothetical protein
MTPLEAVLTLVAPALLAALGLVALSLLPPREGDGTRAGVARRLALPILAGVAFFPADVALNQWHALWPRDGTNRYLAVALGAVVAGVLHGSLPQDRMGRGGGVAAVAVVRALLGAAAAWALLAPLPEQYVPAGLLVGLMAATGVWLGLAGGLLDHADARLPRGAVFGALAASAVAMAPGLFQSGYAGGARMAAGLAALAGGLAVAGVVRRRRLGPAPGAVTVWLGLLGAVLLVTFGYNDVPAPWALALMALAPLGVLGALAVRPARLRFAVGVLAPAAVACAATLGVVASSGQGGAAGEADEDASYYGY